MEERKKNLLIFFGELRTFELIIPHLKNLDSVDIILSTWSESNYDNIFFPIDDKLIKKILPNVKQYHIVNPKEIPNLNKKDNTWKLFWHWKNAINNVINSNDYENVIFHRCDLVSNWDSILNLNIEEDTVYLHHAPNPHPHFAKHDPTAFWINDYYFFGKFDIIKKFVNLFDKDSYPEPHFPIWEVVNENNIKIKNHVLKGFLVRNNTSEYLKELLSRSEIDMKYGYISGPDC
jgi:hypothetical protein